MSGGPLLRVRTEEGSAVRTVESVLAPALITLPVPINGEMRTIPEALESLSVPLTRAVGLAAQIPAVVTAFATLGFASPGDNGGASYVRAAPGYVTTALDFTSADGAKWQNVSSTVSPQMAGAAGVNPSVDRTAFNAALASGRDVLVPAGTYVLPSAISVPSGGRLRALGGAVVLKSVDGGTADLLNVVGASDVRIEGITFNGNRSNVTPGNVVTAFQSSEVVFRRCTWINTRGIAVIFSQTNDSGLDDCRFVDCGTLNRTTGLLGDRKQAVAFSGTGARNYARNSRFTGIGLDAISFGSGQTDNEASGNTIRDVNAAGIYNSATRRSRITNNDISTGSSGGSGIDCPHIKDATITGNQCHENSAAGILIAGNCTDVTMSANVCKNNFQGKATAPTTAHAAGITFDFTAGSTMARISLAANICLDDQGGAAVTQRWAIGVNDGGGARSDILIANDNILVGYDAAGNINESSVFQAYTFGATMFPQLVTLAPSGEYLIGPGTTNGWVKLLQINNSHPAEVLLRSGQAPIETYDPSNGFEVGTNASTFTAERIAVLYDATTTPPTMRLRSTYTTLTRSVRISRLTLQ